MPQSETRLSTTPILRSIFGGRFMITLHLTLPELELLRQTLRSQPDSAALTSLLHKLDEAQRQATRQRICPVCGTTFTQLNNGRIARYCSSACKQKAYRQRLIRTRSRHPPL